MRVRQIRVNQNECVSLMRKCKCRPAKLICILMPGPNLGPQTRRKRKSRGERGVKAQVKLSNRPSDLRLRLVSRRHLFRSTHDAAGCGWPASRLVMCLINKYCTGMETYILRGARVTRHRDENSNLLLVRLILLRRHAEWDRFHISYAPFCAGREESLGTQCANKRMLCDRISPRPSSRTENYARLGVRHALSMTIATPHYPKEVYNNLPNENRIMPHSV
jgi:hypothetical protein